MKRSLTRKSVPQRVINDRQYHCWAIHSGRRGLRVSDRAPRSTVNSSWIWTPSETTRDPRQVAHVLRDLRADDQKLRTMAPSTMKVKVVAFTRSVNTFLPIQQNPVKNGYDENKGYDESYENKCATNYSIITNNNWNDTHNKQLTMHNKYTNDDVDFDDCVVHIMR